MVVEIRIIQRKTLLTGGVRTRNFIFEKGEAKSSNIPQAALAAEIKFPKDGAGDEEENFSINLGVQRELALDWVLYGQTTDRSEGTNSGGVAPTIPPGEIKTYAEMLNYLEDVIGWPGIGTVEYEITLIDKFRTRKALYKLDELSVNTDSKLRPAGTIKFFFQKQLE